jgi:hypothetical protein
MSESEVDDKIMIAPEGKGFIIYRGDTAKLEKGKIKGTLYDIGKTLRPSIGRSWTTSLKKAKEFACIYAKDTKYPIIPIVYHGVAHKVVKGFFWSSEKEVHILKNKSRLKDIEIINRKDCEQIMKDLM